MTNPTPGKPQQPRDRELSSEALPLAPSEDRRWATVAHFSAIAGFIPAMIIHYLFKDRGPFTAQESREVVNFTLPLSILVFVLMLLAIFIPGIGSIFAVLLVAVWLFMTFSGIVAGVEVNKGRPYLYRFNMRLF